MRLIIRGSTKKNTYTIVTSAMAPDSTDEQDARAILTFLGRALSIGVQKWLVRLLIEGGHAQKG